MCRESGTKNLSAKNLCCVCVVTCEGRNGTDTAMTSTAGDGVEEDVQPGPSGCSSPAATLQQEPDPYDEQCAFKATGTKRMLSTVDPHYAHPPDSKRMREMHQRAQDELSQRVIKVVEKELHKAILEKETELEEIDTRILRVQQCLHTIRYCASLSYYNIGKNEMQESKSRDRKLSGLHPAIRKYLNEAQEPPQKTAECLTTKHATQHNTLDPTTEKKGKECCKASQSSNQPVDHTKATTTYRANTTATATESSSESNTPPLLFSQCSDETSEISQTYTAKEANSSRPPSPKHLLPLPPDNTATIAQGRQQQLQKKRRLIVGNTYQYLAPVPGEELVDSFRYKWQLYVRAPPSDPDTSTFLQSVTFILDHSYAPHHIITIKQPPFVLSRRGWGEFKVQLTLRFMDQRNKPIRLLHPLVLSRPDDALGLTGLWRLGQENWYDLWVYLPNPETNPEADGCASVMNEESGPSTLTQELNTGVISSQIENNITVDHEPALRTGVTTQYLNEEDCAKSDNILYELSGGVGDLSNSSPCVKKLVPTSSLNEAANELKARKKESEESGKKKGIANGKTCKVLVQQSDGSFKPYALPSHLYPQAMQIALDHSKQNNTSSNIIGINKLMEQAKSSQSSLYQGADYVAKRNKDQLKPITLNLPTQQSTTPMLSNNKVSAAGVVVGTTPVGAICLAEAESNRGKLTVLPAATDTATTTCPEHVLLQMKKEEKLAVVQKQFSGKPPKQSSISPSFRLFQVQTLSLQTPTHESPTTVKHMNEIPVMLTPEKLKTMGLHLLTKRKEQGVTSTLPVTTTTTPSTTAAATSTSPGVLIQGGRVVVGTNTFQLLTNQGKMAVQKLPVLNMHNSKVSHIPVQSVTFNNKADMLVIKSSGGQVKDIPAIIKTGGNETKLLKVKDSSSLLSAVSEVCSKTDPASQKNPTGANNSEKQEDEEQASTYWEDYLNRVCKACKSNTSSEACVSLWLKMLPLVHPSQTPPSPFSFCQAKSYKQFLRWPLAKQRACEFQRAREVVWWLEECCVTGWERWTVPRVVSWARSHAHTPVACRPILRTDKLQVPASSPGSGKSLSYVGDLELEQQRHQSNTPCTSESPEVDVVGLDEEEELSGGSKRIPGSPLKRQLEYLQWEDGEMGSACEWVGQVSSQLRISLYSEEVAEGCMADAARGTLWKASLSLMEDLLRAAHSQAWSEASHVPPANILVSHVQAALTNSRPEFDLLTEYGLGTPTEEL